MPRAETNAGMLYFDLVCLICTDYTTKSSRAAHGLTVYIQCSSCAARAPAELALEYALRHSPAQRMLVGFRTVAEIDAAVRIHRAVRAQPRTPPETAWHFGLAVEALRPLSTIDLSGETAHTGGREENALAAVE